jgi:predicted nuclease with TOPRIM domain
MNKKRIVIIAGIGLICFALSFTVGLFTRKAQNKAADANKTDGPQVVESLSDNPNQIAPTSTAGVASANNFHAKQTNLDRSLTIKQLKSLIFEMHSKLTEFKMKEKMLAEKEERIQMSMEELQNNVKEMEKLRVKLVTQVSSIKQQQTVLNNKLITIGVIEKTNIIRTASVYDKMKPQPASESMINLTKSDQLDYAVKITYYMTERTSANLLAEITKAKPELAATIIERMRWIEEVKE